MVSFRRVWNRRHSSTLLLLNPKSHFPPEMCVLRGEKIPAQMELVRDIKIGINCSGQDVKIDPEVDKKANPDNGNI